MTENVKGVNLLGVLSALEAGQSKQKGKTHLLRGEREEAFAGVVLDLVRANAELFKEFYELGNEREFDDWFIERANVKDGIAERAMRILLSGVSLSRVRKHLYTAIRGQ